MTGRILADPRVRRRAAPAPSFRESMDLSGRRTRRRAALRRSPTSGQRRAQSIATFTGAIFQIESQYSRIARSEENLPARAVLRIDMRVQAA